MEMSEGGREKAARLQQGCLALVVRLAQLTVDCGDVGVSIVGLELSLLILAEGLEDDGRSCEDGLDLHIFCEK